MCNMLGNLRAPRESHVGAAGRGAQAAPDRASGCRLWKLSF
jgi:hypothetical protein